MTTRLKWLARAPATRLARGTARLLPPVLLGFARTARAQVNVEPLRHEVAGDGLAAHVAESIAGTAGNTRGISFGLSGLLGGRIRRHFGYLSCSADYSHVGGTTQTSKGFAHVRHNYELGPHVWSEVFAQLEADRFRRIALRELLGAGPRVALLETTDLTLYFGTAYMLEYTRLSQTSAARTRPVIAHRSSNYLALSWTRGPTTLSETVYVQPRFADPGDLRLLSVSNLAFKLGDRLSSRIDAGLHYDTRLPLEVKPFDLEIKNVLDLKL